MIVVSIGYVMVVVPPCSAKTSVARRVPAAFPRPTIRTGDRDRDLTPTASGLNVSAQLLRAGLLGRMQVSVDGRPSVTSWPRPAARRLVALLLVTPEHLLPRELLIDRLFHHLPPERAGRALSKALSLARSALDADGSTHGRPRTSSVLAADHVNIWVATSVDVEVDVLEQMAALREGLRTADDATRERQLRAALEDRRPPLVDDRYEPWAIEVADVLEHLRRDGLVALARTTGLPADWQAVVDDDPANEQACAALVAGYLDVDDRPAAAHLLDVHEAAMTDLGLPVRPDLATAARALHAPLDPAAPAPTPTSTAPMWPLFGRDRELATVLAQLRLAAVGHGATVLVTAPSGDGQVPPAGACARPARRAGVAPGPRQRHAW
jgi:DNA-binding SARP family transcriptional activator